MPGGDRTGPQGMGPMTGRGAGFCGGYAGAGFENPVPGRGFGRGMGRSRGMGFGRGRGFGDGIGRGRGMGFGRSWGAGFRGGRGSRVDYGYDLPYAGPSYRAPTKRQEIESLRQQARYAESALADIQQRIAELETEAPEK
jgi:hypothetical protein